MADSDSKAVVKASNLTKSRDVLKKEQEKQKEIRMAVEKYGRGKKVTVHAVKDKKVKTQMKKLENRYKEAAMRGQDAELLHVEQAGYLEAEGMEKTFKFRQKDIVKEVDVQTAKKVRYQLNCSSPVANVVLGV